VWEGKNKERGIKTFLESNENENTIHHNLWDTTKAVLRREFITVSAFTRTHKTTGISNK
jgi:hypothetical protein